MLMKRGKVLDCLKDPQVLSSKQMQQITGGEYESLGKYLCTCEGNSNSWYCYAYEESDCGPISECGGENAPYKCEAKDF